MRCEGLRVRRQPLEAILRVEGEHISALAHASGGEPLRTPCVRP